LQVTGYRLQVAGSWFLVPGSIFNTSELEKRVYTFEENFNKCIEPIINLLLIIEN